MNPRARRLRRIHRRHVTRERGYWVHAICLWEGRFVEAPRRIALLKEVGVYLGVDRNTGESTVFVTHEWGGDIVSVRRVLEEPHRLGDGVLFGSGADDPWIDRGLGVSWHDVRRVLLAVGAPVGVDPTVTRPGQRVAAMAPAGRLYPLEQTTTVRS
jgi:hypothetical protein